MDIVSAAWDDLYKLKIKPEKDDKEIIRFNCIECKNYILVYDQCIDETICQKCGLVQHFNLHYMRNDIEYLPNTSNKIKKSIYRHQDYLNRKLDELSCARVCINTELYNDILIELNGSKATIVKLKKILRSLGHKQKFLQIPTILNMIHPDEYPPIKLNFHQRDKFEKLFLRYIDTFFILKNSGQIKRRNLLNYNFVFYQLFKKLGFKILDSYFEMPKGKKTLVNHKLIWRQICIYNKWL